MKTGIRGGKGEGIELGIKEEAWVSIAHEFRMGEEEIGDFGSLKP